MNSVWRGGGGVFVFTQVIWLLVIIIQFILFVVDFGL